MGPTVWGGINPGSGSDEVTARTLIHDAGRDLGVIKAGQDLSGDFYADSLRRLNRMLDSWSLERLMIRAIRRDEYELTAGRSEYDLGDQGEVLRVQSAALLPLQTTSTTVTIPIAGGGSLTWDAASGTWDEQTGTWDAPGGASGGGETVSTVSTVSAMSRAYECPIGVYGTPEPRQLPCITLDGEYPVTRMWLHPAATGNELLVLYVWTALQRFDDLDTPYRLAPGYAEAIGDGLADRLIPSVMLHTKLPAPLISEIREQARISKARIKSFNAAAIKPRMKCDPALVGGYLSGMRTRR